MRASLYNDSIDVALFNATQKSENRLRSGQNGIILPILTFTVGVLGNGLAIATVLVTKYREERSPSRIASFSREKQSSFARSRSAAMFDDDDSIVSRFKNGAKKLCRKLRQNMKALQVLVLALLSVDLIGILATAPITFHLYRRNHSIVDEGGIALCGYSAFAMTFFGLATMAILATLAVFCLESIWNSFQFRSNLTVKKMFAVISVLLGLCTVVCATPSIFHFTPKQMHPNTWCFTNWQSEILREQVFNYVYAALGILLIATTIICNGLSIVGLVLSHRRFPATGRRYNRGNEIKKDTMIQLSLLTLIYVVCWTPLVIRILDNQVTLRQDGEADRRAIWLATINPMIFPWVYILLRRGFYNLLVDIARSLFRSNAKDTNFINYTWVSNPTRPTASDRRAEVVILHHEDGTPFIGTVGSVSTVNTEISQSHSLESLYDNT